MTFTMFAGAPASATVTVNPDHQYEKVGTQGGQAEVTGDWADSKEVNTVQESELTRKAIQAEKARNAAENDEFGGAITLIAMSIVVSAPARAQYSVHAFRKSVIVASDKAQAQSPRSDTGNIGGSTPRRARYGRSHRRNQYGSCRTYRPGARH